MAQNKRKRQTKHRGTQAGTIESRGRTSRPRSRAEARQQALQRRQGGRTSRANVAPTWNSAIKRAGIAAVVLLALMLVLAKETSTVGAIAVAIVAFIIYIPL
ncbi:MAG TPA: hypothetical protein VGO97_01640, partial [Solirubrobacterales bacterium]|nr:hypothetical protein [Solirubrobacterales bacterium]